MDWFTSLIMDLVWALAFGVMFYLILPDTLKWKRQTPGKLKRFQGLSSLWLVWPFAFGIVTTTLLLVPPTLLEWAILFCCLYAGLAEARHILYVSMKLWAKEQGIRIEGDAAPKGS